MQTRGIRLPGGLASARVSRVEAECRHAGEIPKNNKAARARAHREVLQLLRQGVNPRDGCAIADYLEGAFDLKGRQPDLEQQYMLGVIAKDVEAIQQEQGPAWRSPPSRLMEFCTEKELQNQTGHHVEEWPKVVTKEVMDNALDDLATMPP